MSRHRLLALLVAALAGTAASGCDHLVQTAVSRQASADVTVEQSTRMGEDEKNTCVTCAKFRTRPPSGINVPPQM